MSGLHRPALFFIRFQSSPCHLECLHQAPPASEEPHTSVPRLSYLFKQGASCRQSCQGAFAYSGANFILPKVIKANVGFCLLENLPQPEGASSEVWREECTPNTIGTDRETGGKPTLQLNCKVDQISA